MSAPFFFSDGEILIRLIGLYRLINTAFPVLFCFVCRVRTIEPSRDSFARDVFVFVEDDEFIALISAVSERVSQKEPNTKNKKKKK